MTDIYSIIKFQNANRLIRIDSSFNPFHKKTFCGAWVCVLMQVDNYCSTVVLTIVRLKVWWWNTEICSNANIISSIEKKAMTLVTNADSLQYQSIGSHSNFLIICQIHTMLSVK